MKAFRIISVALMAVLMAASFGACSKMENDEPQKRLAKIILTDDSFDIHYTFRYDDKGLLKNATLETVNDKENNPITFMHTYNYVWNSQSIDVEDITSYNGNILEQNEYTYHLSEGLIRSKNYSDGSGHDFSFGYDSVNRLIRFDDQMITWDNDELTSITVDDEVFWYNKLYTYGTFTPAKGYSPLVAFGITGEALILTRPELAGLMTSKTPVTEIVLPNESNQQRRFEYEIDKDGYISKINEITTQERGESWTTVYTLVWE